MREIHHALVLNMHQPPGNLDDLLVNNEWEAKEILFAYDRMPRALWGYEDIARVHLSLSGTLLETLSHPDFQQKVYGVVDCGTLLWFLQNQRIFEILGTGYYHPVLALIPEADWDEQITRWQAIGRHVFWRSHFAGFWPPEMAFDERLIPHLKRAGYRYVIVDSEYVRPIDPMSWQEARYRPHIAAFGGEEIVVVVRDRELSAAQLSGMDYGWFHNELQERTKFCDFPPLVTTATDGDNGGWFRNVNPKANFWQYFYSHALDEIRAGRSGLRPTFITEYLDRFGAHGRVRIERGAWDTGDHHGFDFTQWQGSQTQRDAMTRIHAASADFHRLAALADRTAAQSDEVPRLLAQAHWHLLRAETSCSLFWGEAWVHKVHKDLDDVQWHLGELRSLIGDAAVAVPAPEVDAPQTLDRPPEAPTMPAVGLNAGEAPAVGG
jgi:alpha-amylase/alpha-mannosidase (GH57 family)